MAALEEMILQALITLLVAALLYAFSRAFELYLIKPYYNFKREVIETKIDLLFYRNILTASLEKETTNKEFIGKARDCQEKIRSRWSRVSVRYEVVPKWMFSRKLPTNKEIKMIEENLIYLSNRSIFKRDSVPDDCVNSDKKINEILKIFKKTI
ncbi:MAG: hypothetical protein Q8O89_06145 [Nanoarchaeota archaeon]|nr:hypothetical protein [Nanoarchaeota archaeon]